MVEQLTSPDSLSVLAEVMRSAADADDDDDWWRLDSVVEGVAGVLRNLSCESPACLAMLASPLLVTQLVGLWTEGNMGAAGHAAVCVANCLRAAPAATRQALPVAVPDLRSRLGDCCRRCRDVAGAPLQEWKDILRLL